MNKNLYDKFSQLIDNEDKDNALLFILEQLDQGESIVNVYQNYLIPVLATYVCPVDDEEICIWKEHARTSIIRTILEATYPYVIKAKKTPIDISVMTLCPQEEYHEIGAIIVNHYFSLLGFKAKYIGANTPTDTILSAIKVLRPDYIAISVTNYYNLVATKRLTSEIKRSYPTIKIIVGGQVFKRPDALKQIDYDYVMQSYDDILAFRNEVETS
jgi:methanogenic corrinoid protein MtbC1